MLSASDNVLEAVVLAGNIALALLIAMYQVMCNYAEDQIVARSYAWCQNINLCVNHQSNLL